MCKKVKSTPWLSFVVPRMSYHPRMQYFMASCRDVHCSLGVTGGVPACTIPESDRASVKHPAYCYIIFHGTTVTAMVKIVKWNVKDLHRPYKRASILRHLKRLKADISLLQETHLGQDDFIRMRKHWVGRVLGSAARGRKAGVLILINKNLPCSIEGVQKDDRTETNCSSYNRRP